MKFIVMHKVDANMEAGGPPDPEIIHGMGRLLREGTWSKAFVDGAGLHRSAQRVRVRFGGGERTATKGPLKGDNELVAGFVMIKAKSMDEAIERASGLAAAIGGDCEIEIGPVVEVWDLGLVPKPEGIVRWRFLLLYKADAAFEAGQPRDPAVRAAMAEWAADMTKHGVLIKSESLEASSSGARLPPAPKEKRKWMDGPFAESKELIAGFTILELESREQAQSFAEQYADVLGRNEVEVRVVREPSEFSS